MNNTPARIRRLACKNLRDIIGELSDVDSDEDDTKTEKYDKENNFLLEGRAFRKPTTYLLPIIGKRKALDFHILLHTFKNE